MAGNRDVGGIAADRLRSFIERIERLEEEKKNIQDDIKEAYAEAKGTGFDTKTMRQLVRLRKMDKDDREEHEALLDLYKAALGMLDGTPLGEAAVRRLMRDREPTRSAPAKDQTDIEDFTKPKLPSSPAAQAPWEEEDEGKRPPRSPAEAPDLPDVERSPKEESVPECTVEEARHMGREAALRGDPVTANPFPPHDLRRAAWDEEWCRASGSDGMELPEAWRRTPKKKTKGDADDAGNGESDESDKKETE